jgi:hypothetical protein
MSYTVAIEAAAVDAKYLVTRWDITSGAAGCAKVSSTAIGRTSAMGVLVSKRDFRCHRVVAKASEGFWIDTRDPLDDTSFMVADTNGNNLECYQGPCYVQGSTSYQVIVSRSPYKDGDLSYRADTWRVSGANARPRECGTVPSNAYGFGPLTGTLSGDNPASCVAMTVKRSDRFSLEVASTDDGANLPAPFMVGDEGLEECHGGDVEYDCYPGEASSGGVVLFVFSIGDGIEKASYRIGATCIEPLCGENSYTVTAVTPATAESGTQAVITLHGSAFHEQDRLELARIGHDPIPVSVRGVAADRKTLTAVVDLSNAAAGSWDLTARSRSGATAEREAAFTVKAPTLPAVKPRAAAPAASFGMAPRATTIGLGWRAAGRDALTRRRLPPGSYV